MEKVCLIWDLYPRPLGANSAMLPNTGSQKSADLADKKSNLIKSTYVRDINHCCAGKLRKIVLDT